MSRPAEKTTFVSRGRLSGVLRGRHLENRALADAAGDRDGVDEAIYYRARLILGESLRRPENLRQSSR
jgi:hypothetical protein